MHDYAVLRDATIRALSGESDVHAVRAVFGHHDLARIVALSNHAHPNVQRIAALAGGTPSLLTDADRRDPDAHIVVQSMIGTTEGRNVLWLWANIIPSGWGRECADALIDAVRFGVCPLSAAAALVGPNDTTAALINEPNDIAATIRRWGQSQPDAPGWWMERISASQRDRLLNRVYHLPSAFAACLPWLPPESARLHHLNKDMLESVINAFACAAPTACMQHADVLSSAIRHASEQALAPLVRLALVAPPDIAHAAWQRVSVLVSNRQSDIDIDVLLSTAAWDELPSSIHAIILNDARRSAPCAAIAAARGMWDMRDVHPSSALASVFFAALDPKIWDALSVSRQRAWRRKIMMSNSHLAIRSLGIRPEIVLHATVNDDVIQSARRHTENTQALRAAFFPVALREAPLAIAPALLAAIPPSQDDPAWRFSVVSGRREIAPLPSPGAVAWESPVNHAAAIMQRVASDDATVEERCAALASVLHGRTWHEVTRLWTLLTNDARNVLKPALTSNVLPLVRRDRRLRMRDALARLTLLSPDVAIPAFHALVSLGREWECLPAASVVIQALRASSDLFLDLTESLVAHVQDVILPLPEHPAIAHALRDLARDDPLSAHRLAMGLHQQSWCAVRSVLRSVAPAYAHAILTALSTDSQTLMGNDATRDIRTLAADDSTDALLIQWRRMCIHAPAAALMLATAASPVPAERDEAIAALATCDYVVRVVLPLLRPDLRNRLLDREEVRIMIADTGAVLHAKIDAQRRTIGGKRSP